MMRIYRNIAFLIVAMTFMSAYVADAMKLNGTRIDKKNNLFGLVKDSRTGKGIAGVPVTDGYTFTVTDRNGVYQFVTSSRERGSSSMFMQGEKPKRPYPTRGTSTTRVPAQSARRR